MIFAIARLYGRLCSLKIVRVGRLVRPLIKLFDLIRWFSAHA